MATRHARRHVGCCLVPAGAGTDQRCAARRAADAAAGKSVLAHAPTPARASRPCLAATSVARLKAFRVTRYNSNAMGGRRADESLRPISACGLHSAWRTRPAVGTPLVRCRATDSDSESMRTGSFDGMTIGRVKLRTPALVHSWGGRGGQHALCGIRRARRRAEGPRRSG